MQHSRLHIYGTMGDRRCRMDAAVRIAKYITGLVVLALCNGLLAQPGSLDPAFGTAGVAAMPSGITGVQLVVQSDGKVVTAATVRGSFTQFAVVRFNIDGSLDSGFGAAGIV